MARRKRGSRGPEPEDIIKLIVGALLLISLAIGGAAGFIPVFLTLLKAIAVVAVVAAVLGLSWLIWRARRRSRNSPPVQTVSQSVAPTQPSWSVAAIANAFPDLDWYQFEKVNAAILQLEGWSVQRRGGASPDGGVDLIASRGSEKKLIQCKHWLTWKVQEKVVRELIGSMTHMGVSSAGIHASGGWTQPAATLAAQHGIELSDRDELAQRARTVFSDSDLTHWFTNAPKCCPKCDGPMVLRTGNFESFWGCRSFPRCRGKLNTRPIEVSA